MEKIIQNNSIIDIDKVKPNDYNPKPDYTQSEELKIEFEKIKNSLKYHGQIDPILVRESDKKGEYEIINGYHRWLAMKELGFKQIEIKNLGKIDRIEAIKKALSTEELRIPLDVIEVAELVKKVKESEEGLKGLPYLEKEITEKIDLLDFDWKSFEREIVDVVEEDEKEVARLEKKGRYYFVFKKQDLEVVKEYFQRNNAIWRLDEKKLLKLIVPKYAKNK